MKRDKPICDLKTCLLCKHCEAEWLPTIDTHRKNIHYKKGELIFKEGDILRGMFFVLKGTVKVHKKWGAEKELIVRFAKNGDILGHRGLGSDTLYSVSATALEPVTVCFIDTVFFNASLKMNTAFLFRLMLFLAEELRISEKKMRDLAHMQVKGRIAQSLLTLRVKFGENDEGYIELPLSRHNLASFAGTTYETAFRILNEWTADNIIRISGKSISLMDASGLAAFCDAE